MQNLHLMMLIEVRRVNNVSFEPKTFLNDNNTYVLSHPHLVPYDKQLDESLVVIEKLSKKAKSSTHH